MASETVITALKIVGFSTFFEVILKYKKPAETRHPHPVLLGVSIIFMGGILYLWRQSRNRKRAHRQTQAGNLTPAAPSGLQSRPSQRQKDKKEEAKRRQNLAWGVVDEEAGEKDADEMGGIGTLSTDAIRRMGIARTDSGLLGTAVLHKTDTRIRPAVAPVQTRTTNTINVTPGIGSGNGPRSPPKALDMPDSHRKLSDNPFSNQHASRRQDGSNRPLGPSSAATIQTMRPSRPAQPSEAGSPKMISSPRQPFPTGSGIRFPDATTQKATVTRKPDPRGRVDQKQPPNGADLMDYH